MPIEHALTGNLNRSKWRGLARHGSADKYADMVSAGYDLTAAAFVQELTSRSAIPGYFNESEWKGRIDGKNMISTAEYRERINLALDLQALAIKDLHERLSTLE